jgi:glycosyltransferase involved in cell wall biosynthesis
MATGRRSILVDARLNGIPGAHGLARSVMKLAEHMGRSRDGLTLRILVNPSRTQLFPLAGLSGRAELLGTDIRLGAVHRCRELGQLIRDAGAAVLYVPYPLFAPLVCPCPMVMTIHDCIIEGNASHAGGWHRQVGLKVTTKAMLRRSAAVTAPTRATLAEIRRHYPAAPNPTLIPNGIDTRPFTTITDGALAAARRRYGLPQRFILTVGAHRPHKNHGVLLRALAAMPADVSLVIVGYFDPNFRDKLPARIAELGLESRVRLVPEVAEEALPAVYRAASVFAFPSVVEGFGLPVLEAMAAGVPVVASAIPALAEVCGSAALLVPPDDAASWASAMSAVLEDEAAAAGMIAAGTALAAAATWETGGRALSDLLSSVAYSTSSAAAAR